MADNPSYESAITRAGFIPVNSFENGFTLTSPNQALYLAKTNEYFIWKGALPKVVPAGATPDLSGGFGPEAWIDVSYVALGSLSGAALVGRGQTTLDEIITLHVKQFGAREITSDPDFDNVAAFQAAFDYAAKNGIPVVNITGRYRFKTAPRAYELPRDMGEVAAWAVAQGEKPMPPEDRLTMPVCVDVPSQITIWASPSRKNEIIGPWDINTSPIDRCQCIGLCFRVNGYPQNTRMTHAVERIQVHNLSMSQFIIGFLSDGIMYNGTRFADIMLQRCGIPFVLQGFDNGIWTGDTQLTVNLAGGVIGGMWLMRENSWYGGASTPPYTTENRPVDIAAVGWSDSCKFEKISCSYGGQPFGDRHCEIDEFFDKFFYKTVNEAARMTKKSEWGELSATQMARNPYRGIAHRVLSIFNRYRPWNTNNDIYDCKVYGTARVPFLAPYMWNTGNPQAANTVGDFGTIYNGYYENCGSANPNIKWSLSNDWYALGKDPYNKDYSHCPWFVSEGDWVADIATNQGSADVMQSRLARRVRSREFRDYVSYDKAELDASTTITSAKTLRFLSMYSRKDGYFAIERLCYGVHQTQPMSWDWNDSNPAHRFKFKIDNNKQKMILCHGVVGGAVTEVAPVTHSVFYLAGRIKVFIKLIIPDNAASLTGDMFIRNVPLTNNSLDYGHADMELNVLTANIVGLRARNVYQVGTNTIIGETRMPKEFRSVAGADTNLRLYEEFNRNWGVQLRISDFAPGSLLEFSIEYNGNWNIWSAD